MFVVKNDTSQDHTFTRIPIRTKKMLCVAASKDCLTEILFKVKFRETPQGGPKGGSEKMARNTTHFDSGGLMAQQQP